MIHVMCAKSIESKININRFIQSSPENRTRFLDSSTCGSRAPPRSDDRVVSDSYGSDALENIRCDFEIVLIQSRDTLAFFPSCG
jgi:hypothetical protein